MNSFESFLETLSSLVYEQRQKQKLTQSELAKASGRSQSSIAKVESSPPLDLSLRVLFQIAEGLSLNLSDLIAVAERKAGLTKYSKMSKTGAKKQAPLKDTAWQRIRTRLESTPPEKRKQLVKTFDQILNTLS